MTTKIITVEATPPAESTGADYYKGAPLNAAEFDQNLVNLRAAVDRKASLNNPTFTGTVTLPSTTSIGDVSATELQYLNSVTSNVQDQINSKQATITTLGTANGGTGLTSFTSGGVVYASSSSALTTGSALTFDGANLGIGTSSPFAKLHVGGDVLFGTSGAASNIYHIAGWSGGTSSAWKTTSDYYGALSWSSSLYDSASGPSSGTYTERMRLDSSGNLLVGTTTAYGKLTVNGNAYNTTGVWGTISDQKLKENIVDATPKLDSLCKVKVRNYNLIGDELKQIGVIAQELEEIFPSMVDETSDYEELIKTREVEVPAVLDEDGNEVEPATTKTEEYSERVATGTTTKSVKYSVFVPMLIKAVQEQQAIIESLTQRIEALEYTKQGE